MIKQNRRNTVYVLLILSLVTGLLTGRAFFFNIAYLLGGLLFVSWLWAWLSVRWLVISRRTRARRTQVGRTLSESFAIRNLTFLPKLWLEIQDQSTLPNHRASHVVPMLGGNRNYSWDVETYCLVRGEFRLGPMTINSGDPFGLFFTPRVIQASSRVIVYPMTVELRHFQLPIGTLSGGEAQRQRTHYITTNAAGVRDYVPGDSYNRIHWRSSARRDRLVVKEFEIDPLVDIWLFCDFSAQSVIDAPGLKRINGDGAVIPNQAGIPASTEEYVVIAGASLAQYFIKVERAVGFAAYTPHREIHQPERGNRQMTHIFESLAIARSKSPYSMGEMLTLETPYFTRGTSLILITSSVDTRWIAEAQVLAQRGIRPMCIFVDPATFGGSSSDEMRARLQVAGMPTIVIRRGDDIATALARREF